MSVKECKAVVFDLDDTLYPERDYVMSGFRAVAAWSKLHLGNPAEVGFFELRVLFEKGVRGDTFNRWLAARGIVDDSLVAQLVQVYREHDPTIAPFPEVPGVLESLRREYLLGIVSDGYLAVQQRKLAALRLAPYFDAIIFSDEWGREAWKPNPRPFREVLDRLGGIAPEEAVYVADNPDKDFLGARGVGLTTIQICRPNALNSHREPLTEQHRFHVAIQSLNELETALKSLMGTSAATEELSP